MCDAHDGETPHTVSGQQFHVELVRVIFTAGGVLEESRKPQRTPGRHQDGRRQRAEGSERIGTLEGIPSQRHRLASAASLSENSRYVMIRHDTMCCIHVRSDEADVSQLDLYRVEP